MNKTIIPDYQRGHGSSYDPGSPEIQEMSENNSPAYEFIGSNALNDSPSLFPKKNHNNPHTQKK